MTVLAMAGAVAPSAYAQSAGDDQYVDPFQQEAGGDLGSDNNDNNSGSDQSGSSAPQPAADPSTGDTLAADTTSGGDGVALPHTGLPLAGLVVSGVFLLAGGTALRRRA